MITRLRITRLSILTSIAVSASILWAGCVPGTSETEEGRTSDVAFTEVTPVERGHAAFVSSCASCHGQGGRGGGPVAEFLTIPVPDLTLLATENDGHFPEDLVFNTIDGRRNVPAHGSREMPVWGNIWADGDANEEDIWQRTGELVEYIRQMQADDQPRVVR